MYTDIWELYTGKYVKTLHTFQIQQRGEIWNTNFSCMSFIPCNNAELEGATQICTEACQILLCDLLGVYWGSLSPSLCMRVCDFVHMPMHVLLICLIFNGGMLSVCMCASEYPCYESASVCVRECMDMCMCLHDMRGVCMCQHVRMCVCVCV